ncbi:MAG: phospholipase [Bacteroidaceae bacterium]|nr:phospholipase [Bacteroidaceae bacterium]
MNNATYFICATVLLLMFVLYYLDRWNKTHNTNNRTGSGNSTGDADPTVPQGECCGKHVVCEKQKLAEARMRSAQYFDDEELDRFRGRKPDGYTDREIEEFRYVMYTMQQDEVREWMECLQARDIELPDQLKEECYSMMNGI